MARPRLIPLLFAAAAPAAAAALPQGQAPLTAAAFSPDGGRLAVAGHRRLLVCPAALDGPCRALPGAPDKVNSIAFDPAGKRLAAGGGRPGAAGEIVVWNLSTSARVALTGVHKDVVTGLAWSPSGDLLAAGSYDRLVSLWNPAGGSPRILKDHTDAVFAVAFSPNGRLVASVGADRTLKMWSVQSGRRLYTLTEATAELYTAAFHPTDEVVVAGGADRMLRTWRVTERGGVLERSAFAHDGPVLRVVFAPEGKRLWTSAEDRTVKSWDPVALREELELERQPDWGLGLAVSPDGRRVAVARHDGAAALYDAANGRRLALLRPPTEPPPPARGKLP